ncbi:Ger(x)C family spore germination protein [Paenibacillus glycanilyticus]|uniref:Ger(X)C family spore germination protein n=1 Tax=Paenibacillus glycanilyticus TaxID=126569 RepID=A0ABQ6GB20_9BACL|nr:Ger(x)C family spore germination protein [Paenibacillus glycanilyticus]GLX67827.1 hypothetical protein MU1_21720 [Paenibacillus glycanilyticus]
MKKMIAAVMSICVLLTGCTDQIKLKNLLFVDIMGLDYVDQDKDKTLQFSFVTSSLNDAYQGGGKPANQYHEQTGKNIYEAVIRSNKEMPGILSVLETRLYIISSSIAKDDPLSHLHIASQFQSNPLYAYLAVYDGDLSKLLSKPKIKDNTVSNYLFELLEDEIERGRIPSNKLLNYILGGDQFMNDFILNRFEPYKDEVRLGGTALFSNGKYTGYNLSNEDTLLALLMNGEPGKLQFIFGKSQGLDYSIHVQDTKQAIHIQHSGNNLSEIALSLRMKVRLVDDGKMLEMHTKQELDEKQQIIAEHLTARAEKIVEILQQANCDYFQLGQQVAAYHPNLYQSLNWREQYPSLTVKPTVKVAIINSGNLE